MFGLEPLPFYIYIYARTLSQVPGRHRCLMLVLQGDFRHTGAAWDIRFPGMPFSYGAVSDRDAFSTGHPVQSKLRRTRGLAESTYVRIGARITKQSVQV